MFQFVRGIALVAATALAFGVATVLLPLSISMAQTTSAADTSEALKELGMYVQVNFPYAAIHS